MPEPQPFDYIKTYNVFELERIACRYVNQLGENLKIPVDIELIVERNGIELDIWPALAANHKIYGMVGRNPDTGKIIIQVDDKLADEEYRKQIYRMTIAEEFAHILLHRKAIENVNSPEDFKILQTHSFWHEHDRNAKRLAAALLMPASYIKEDSQKLYKVTCQTLKRINYKYNQTVKNIITRQLAEKYAVSQSSMSYRLNEWPIRIFDMIDKAMKNKVDFL